MKLPLPACQEPVILLLFTPKAIFDSICEVLCMLATRQKRAAFALSAASGKLRQRRMQVLGHQKDQKSEAVLVALGLMGNAKW